MISPKRLGWYVNEFAGGRANIPDLNALNQLAMLGRRTIRKRLLFQWLTGGIGSSSLLRESDLNRGHTRSKVSIVRT